MKHKGLLWLCAFSVVVALIAGITLNKLSIDSDSLKSESKTLTSQVKESQKETTNSNSDNSSDEDIEQTIKDLEEKLSKLQKNSKISDDVKKQAQKVIMAYLKNRYNYSGLTNESYEKIIKSVKKYCTESFLESLEEDLKNTSSTVVGNGPTTLTPLTEHTGVVKDIYFSSEIEEIYVSGNPNNTEDDASYALNTTVTMYTNDSFLGYYAVSLDYDKENDKWLINGDQLNASDYDYET